MAKASKKDEKAKGKKKPKAEEKELKKKKGKQAAEPDEDEDSEDESPKGKKKKKGGDGDDTPPSWLDMLNGSLDDIAKRQGVDTDSMMVAEPMSTGLLAYDLLLGGGIRPAMYTHAGFEQGGKTTGALKIMAAAIKQLTYGMKAFWDYEGSTANSLDYVGNILRTEGVKATTDEIFGKRDPLTGKWVIKPQVRYFAETRGEAFFDWFAAVLREMPDKRYVAGKWWLVFDEANKKHKLMVGDDADANMKKKYGKGLWVPAPDGKLQGIVFADSYPAMNPESNDDEEANNSLGVHARFFAKHLPRIKGRLAQKMVALVGINQLREVPMAMYGPKEKEAAGQALRFNSDVRTWWNSRSSGMPFNPKFDTEERVEIESSVMVEGKDRYRYVQVVAKKNKLSQPGRKIWVRLWTQDAKGNARGFDPVFDTIYYLRVTGQLQAKNRGAITLKLHKLGDTKALKWSEIKLWILGDKEAKQSMSKKAGLAKAIDLRAFCFKQMRDGIGEALFVNVSNAGKKEDADD